MSEHDELQAMWNARAAGEEVQCTSCRAARLALSIGMGSYQWRCMDCGRDSSWFVVKAARVTVRIHKPVRIVNPAAPDDGS